MANSRRKRFGGPTSSSPASNLIPLPVVDSRYTFVTWFEHKIRLAAVAQNLITRPCVSCGRVDRLHHEIAGALGMCHVCGQGGLCLEL